MIAKIQAVYDQLDGGTISPRRLREMFDDATMAGAVFALVDRIVAADPTAFVIPPEGS